jgi:hypothetical protein
MLLLAACLAGAWQRGSGSQADEKAALPIDRSIAVVGERVITAREVARQLRLQAFYERQPVNDSVETRRVALNQLIERRLMQSEMRLASFGSDKGRAAAEMEALRKSDFGGGLKFEAALVRYGLREKDVEQFVAELVDVLRFIEFRFRTGMQITPEEIQEYYTRSYLPGMRRINEAPAPIEQIQGVLEESIAQRRVDSMLDQWLRELRAGTRVELLRPDGPAEPITDPLIPLGPESQAVNP